MKNIYIFCILKFRVDLCNFTKKTPPLPLSLLYHKLSRLVNRCVQDLLMWMLILAIAVRVRNYRISKTCFCQADNRRQELAKTKKCVHGGCCSLASN